MSILNEKLNPITEEALKKLGFEMNEYGVISPAFEENISNENIKEVDNWEYEE